MKNLVFDASALSQLFSKDTSVSQHLLHRMAAGEYERYIIPAAADAEVRYGFKIGNREIRNLGEYGRFGREFNAGVVAADSTTSRIYADLADWSRKMASA